MTGPPANVLEEIPDRAALAEFLTDQEPPFRVGYRRGEAVEEADVDRIDTSRGGDLAELHIDDRYVTVNVGDELKRVEVSQ